MDLNAVQADEIDKLLVALHLAKDSTYESKVVHLVDPVLEILRENEEKIRAKLKEIDGVVVASRTLIVQKIVEVSDISGVTVEGDKETERDAFASRQAEAQNDEDMDRWQLVSSQLAIAVDTFGQTAASASLATGTWPLVILPCRNSNFINRPSYVDRVMSLVGEEAQLPLDLLEISDKHPMGPSWRFPRYVAVLGAAGGEGKSEIVREVAHVLLDRTGQAKFFAWLDAGDEYSLVRSYRRLAHRIQLVDPTFCRGQRIKATKRVSLQESVNDWLCRLNVRWLLVVDNFNSSNGMMTTAIPTARTEQAVGSTVIVTSRNVDLADIWTSILTTGLTRGVQFEVGAGANPQRDVAGLVRHPQVEGDGEEEWRPAAALRTMIIDKVLSADEVWRMCHEVLGREAGLYEEVAGGESLPSDPKQLRTELQALCDSLHDTPLALLQAFCSCLEVYRYRRQLRRVVGRSCSLPDHFPLTYLSRVKEYSHWMTRFNSAAETQFPAAPRSAAMFKTLLVAQGISCEKSGGRPDAFVRCLELLAFLSPLSVSLRMLDVWLRPPHTPVVARISKKWRLPVVTGSGRGKHHLPYESAEFEIVVQSVYPMSCAVGDRFRWRVHRSYEEIRAAHMEAQVSYSEDMTKVVFPSGSLPYGVSNEVLEDAVSALRAQLSSFIASLVESECWGRICLSKSIAQLLGFTRQLNTRCFGNMHSTSSTDASVYTPAVMLGDGDAAAVCEDQGRPDTIVPATPPVLDDPFLKLVDPLYSLGFVTVLDVDDPYASPQGGTSASPLKTFTHLQVSICREQQVSVIEWLSATGRLQAAVTDATSFLLSSFKAAHSKYKKEFSERGVAVVGRAACEELLPHVMNILAVAASSTNEESFELCSIAYHFAANEGLYDDAVFCATRCVEIIKDRTGSHGQNGELDGLWHAYLADMFCRLDKGDEAKVLYEYALNIFKTCCGSCHRHTLSVMERLGRLLFELGKYKHATRILEEALGTARQLFCGNAAAATSTAVGSANSLHIADRIDQLVRVIAVDAPDLGAVSRCLELKHEELDILRRARGEFSPSVAKCLTSVGELERKLGRSQKATACFEDSLDILARCVGPDSVELVSPLFNLALEQHTNRKYGDALKLYSRALAIKEQAILLGAQVDSSIASIHDSLGMLYCDQQKDQEALEHLQRACDMYISLYGKENHQVAISLNNLAYAWGRMGNKAVARSLYTRALDTLRRVGSRSDEDVIATTLNALGELWMAAKNYDEARPLYVESLTMRVKLYGERHRDTVAVMKNLCTLYYSSGALEEARDVCSNALILQKSLSGANSEAVAELTGQLAEVSRRMGKLDEAKTHYKRSIAALRTVHGNKHPAVALQLNNLASVLFSMESYEDSEVLYEESRKVLTAYHGRDHLSVAASLNNLAELNKHLGKYSKSLSFHEQCLDIRLRLLGPEHTTVALSLGQVADVLRLDGSLDAAVDACSQCLGIRIKSYGMDHEEVVDSLKLLALLMIEKKETPEARRLLQDALRSQEQIDKESAQHNKKVRAAGGSLETASIIEAICDITLEDADSNEKMTLLERSLKIRRTLQGEEHPEVAKTLSSLGETCLHSGETEQAMEFHRVARAIREKNLGENHPCVVDSLTHIADCLKSQGRLDESQSLYEQTVSCLRTHYGENHPSVAAAMMRLVDLLQLLEEYPTALAICESAIYINTRHFGEASIVVAANQKRAADLRRCLNSPSEARSYYFKALSTFRRKSPSQFSVDVLGAMEGLVWAMEELGNGDEAAALRVEMLTIQKKVFGDMHPRIVQELNTIGRTLHARCKYLEASDHFHRALNIGLEVHEGEDHESVADSLHGLALVLEAQGRSMEATPLRERARDIRKKLGIAIGGSDPSTEAAMPSHSNGGSRPSSSIFSTFSLLLSGKME